MISGAGKGKRAAGVLPLFNQQMRRCLLDFIILSIKDVGMEGYQLQKSVTCPIVLYQCTGWKIRETRDQRENVAHRDESGPSNIRKHGWD